MLTHTAAGNRVRVRGKNFSASRLMGDCGADFLKPICPGHWNGDFARGHHLCRLQR
jgi:hypothetical protein